MLIMLDIPPSSSDALFWTDFIELKAIVHPDRCFSRGDFVTLMKRAQETARNSTSPDRRNTALAESRWQDIVNYSENRVQIFGDAYPFRVSGDRDTIELHTHGQQNHLGYLSLLLSASMRHFPLDRRDELARYFEEVSFSVFRALMPEGAEVHPNWAHGGAAARYQGTLFQKMTAIAKDIRSRSSLMERDYQDGNSGDGGLDIVAWHPMGDEREGIPIAMAQCGCSKTDWKHKKLEASPTNHYRISVMHSWATYYFMPFDFRHSDGGWARNSDLSGAIIVDRLRLLKLSTERNIIQNWPILPLLQEVQQLQAA